MQYPADIFLKKVEKGIPERTAAPAQSAPAGGF
jgi:hypothetical protein